MCDYLGCPAAAGLRPDHIGAVRSQYLYQLLYYQLLMVNHNYFDACLMANFAQRYSNAKVESRFPVLGVE